ncbi:MAG: TonB family protein [Sulfuricella sp.]|nr:TonB family protein [Sulfuricella sp.]
MVPSQSSQETYGREPRISVQGILAVAGLHVAAIALLVSLDVVKLPPQMATLMVHVIQPEPPKSQEIAPPIPKPVARQPVPQPRQPPTHQQQVLAAETSAPSAANEVPVVKAPPAPVSAASSPAATEPRFDADYLHNPAPVYPAMSKRLEESGKAILRVYVEPSGKPSQIQVKASSGSPRLDQAAQDAVWRWKFVPARRGDEAVGAWVLVPIDFNLRG